MRVVSTACSNTEIVCALGLSHLLVGVDDHSDHPAEVVEALPRVGPDLSVDPEKVLALEPDLVLASLTVPGHEQVVSALLDAGLEVLAPSPESLGEVLEDVLRIARRLGHPERGEHLVQLLKDGLAPNRPEPDPPRIAVEWWPNKPTILAGGRSWVADLVTLAGGQLVLGDEDVISRPVAPEEATTLAPDAVVVSWCGVPPERYRLDEVRERPGWAKTPAVQHDHLFAVPEAFLGRPGPRLVEGLERLRQVVAEVRRGRR